MRSRSGAGPGGPPGPAADEGEAAPAGPRIGPAAVLWLSAGIGLAAGFLDLAVVVVRKRLIEGDFYRLGDGFPWIIPVGVATIALLPGLLPAAIAARRRGGIRPDLAVAPAAFVGSLDLGAKLPLEFWASLLLSGGMAAVLARFARRRPGLVRVAHWTTPVLAAAVLILALGTTGRRAWTEHRAVSALPPPPPGARNVLLIVWDTVRASELSLHGYGRRTTPNLERLAARGATFRHAFATSSWTLPSHASLFTGRWPHELSAGWQAPLDDCYPTLAGRLSTLGYDTAGFVANLDYCGRETGLARGFAHYEDYPLGVREALTRYVGLGRRIDPLTLAMAASLMRGGGSGPRSPIAKEHAKSAEEIDRAFLDWLSWHHHRGRPFFAFLNYNDAHTPYEVPDESAAGFGLRPSSWRDRLVLQQWNMLDKLKVPYRDVQMARDIYDDAIAYLDRRLGALLDELRRRGVLDETLVIVASDHGEHLGDHALFFHGCSLYRQVVEVPLVIVDPAKVPAGRTVDEPVSLRDLPATILGLLGLDRGGFPGESLSRFWATGGGEARPAPEPLLMETDRPTLLTNQGREPAAKGPMRSLIAGGMHYIRSANGHEELYALESDPDERTDAAGLPEAQGVLEGFRRGLGSILRAGPKADLSSVIPR